ncbi:hypothetical protein [Bifidobacterium bohemicum]|nr:hypothetical protein [Bifidobacterium bohemicum]
MTDDWSVPVASTLTWRPSEFNTSSGLSLPTAASADGYGLRPLESI